MNPALEQQLKTLPYNPGIYIYKDGQGKVLYVGKAKVLKARVRSYFRASANLDAAKQQMVGQIASLETIQTDTENEALVLEANLIRKHLPPYNVVLRDDKYYLFIKITKEAMPRVFPVRRISQDGAKYFGPYSSARSVRSTLQLLRRIFPHRAEKNSPHDIVFPHPLFSRSEKSALSERSESRDKSEIGESKGTPTYPLPPTTYNLNIQNIIRFLKGDRASIVTTLTAGMKKSAKAEHFEQAKLFRDQLQAIERLEGFQKVYLPRKEQFDAVSLVQQEARSAANVFQIREGKLLNKLTFLLQHRAATPAQDALRQFLLQYYGVAQDIPRLILIPLELTDSPAIANWVRPSDPPIFATPVRGVKRQLLTMGETNAQQLLDEQAAVFESEAKQKQAHAELITALGLDPKHTHRIETYDISNIQGRLATASMVVFVDGQSEPKQYRKFRMHLEGTPNDFPTSSRRSEAMAGAASDFAGHSAMQSLLIKPDDFAMIRQTLMRRFAHHSQDSQWPMPDLIIIDGGKGQLSSAKKILDGLGITTPVISIAKQEEEIFACPERNRGVPLHFKSIRLPYNSQALYLIQRMRDEAHRFTITYHRLLRSKAQKRSLLDEVPGGGPKTKKKLLAQFGSLKNIRAASNEDLTKILGPQKTNILREYI